MQDQIEIDVGKSKSIEYRLPQKTPLSVWVYSIDVSTVMLVDESGRSDYLNGGTPEAWIKSSRSQHHVVSGVLPRRDKWFLLIENNSEIAISARYGIFIVPFG